MTEIPLRDAYVRFSELLTLAEEYFEAGDLPAAVGLAHIGVLYVFPGKGLFSSPRLEHLLLEIGKRIPTDSPHRERKRDNNARNVLHVLTHARPVGGDSRFAWRWIQLDGKSRHSVAITTQASVEGMFDIPQTLNEAVEKSGGFLKELNAPTTNPLAQAHELRGLCQEMDVVVLHLFPYDIVPLLALAAGCKGVKVLFVDHADHVFWVGASVAHWIAHLRRQSDEFLRNQRRLEPNQSSILPIPLVPSAPTITRHEAKRALGYGPDVVLLLTIASPFKYSSPGQISFLDLVTPIVEQLPQAVLIAVGPDHEGAWRAANMRTKGRIVSFGTQWDNDLLYTAADVYLDSVPFSSITSLLEAGSHGLPLLGHRPDPKLMLLGPGAPGLDGVMELADNAEAYHILLTRLINDVEFRHQSGQRIQESILSLHTGNNWSRTLDEVYAKLEHSSDVKCLRDKHDTFESDVLNEALVRLYSRVPFSIRRLIRESIGSLPYRSRLAITRHLHCMGFDFCFLNLLPPPIDTIVHRLGHWIKEVLRRFMRLS